jgi:hypothetical protein
MAEETRIKFLDKLEEEAVGLLNQFKEHPIKSILVGMFILWGIKKIKELFRGI